jgi:protein arginine N-methyltransferase 6
MFLNDNNNTNGYNHHQPPLSPPTGMLQTHSRRDRARHGTRRSRASTSTSNSIVRVSDTEQQPPQQQEQQQPNRSPCTDYDMAYFHSYAHLGIHQEMIKVFNFNLFQFCFSSF